eukprot:753711-Hanusia_phi.AAC.5
MTGDRLAGEVLLLARSAQRSQSRDWACFNVCFLGWQNEDGNFQWPADILQPPFSFIEADTVTLNQNTQFILEIMAFTFCHRHTSSNQRIFEQGTRGLSDQRQREQISRHDTKSIQREYHLQS